MEHNLTQPHLLRGVRDLFAKNEYWMKLRIVRGKLVLQIRQVKVSPLALNHIQIGL